MRRFMQLDVFDSGPLSGNPLAVVLDGSDLTTEQMQQFTDWTNLSEATFLLPPTAPSADYRVRIFCPGRELPFAGHPTLGSCQAWLASGGRPRDGEDVIVQECGAGLVPIRRDGARLAFAAPPMIRSGPVDAELLAERCSQLGLSADEIVDAAWVDNGPGWMGVLLNSAEAVLDVTPPSEAIPGFDVGLVGPYPPGEECAIEVRALFADLRGAVREDPVTGSLNASLAEWLLGSGRIAAPYLAAQGRTIGRAGRVHVDVSVDRAAPEGDAAHRAGAETNVVWIGGHSTVVIDGTVAL